MHFQDKVDSNVTVQMEIFFEFVLVLVRLKIICIIRKEEKVGKKNKVVK